jgi:hypothetical protein
MTHEGEEGVGTPLKENQPMRDKNGRLHTDPETVSKIMTEHYRTLHQDDPLRACHDDSWWTTTLPFLKEQLVNAEVVDDLCWQEVLVVIRGMNRDTAPGLDELHINMFKGMVREESMAELQKQLPGRTRWEGIQVDLLAEKLPQEPLTRLGKAIWKIIWKIWTTEEFPM